MKANKIWRYEAICEDMKQWSRQWIANREVLCSKPLGDSTADSAFHPSKIDKIGTRNFWELSSKK